MSLHGTQRVKVSVRGCVESVENGKNSMKIVVRGAEMSYVEGNFITDERDTENDTISNLCHKQGYQYHLQCNDASCSCECHYEGA